MNNPTKVLGFHFTQADRRLGHGDGRQVVIGETLNVDGDIRVCRWGLHLCLTVADALRYAPGYHLWRVEGWGNKDSDSDKMAFSNRRAIFDYGDIFPLIVEFAGFCAERANMHAIEAADAVARADARADAAAAAHTDERKIQENWWQEKLIQIERRFTNK